MNGLLQQVPAWQTFYLLTGTAAATLMGLLFVAMSLHTEVFRRQGRSNLEVFGALTFNCYFYVLVIAILFVIPGLPPPALGIPLIAFGLLASTGGRFQRRRARAFLDPRNEKPLSSRFTVPLIGLIGMAALGCGIAFGVAPCLYGMVVVILLLLGAASQNAWTLLTGRQVSPGIDSTGKEAT
jgi:hypothetical protein